VEWANRHPGAEKIAAKTINKLMSGPQAILEWANMNGFLHEDVPWSNPFARMALKEAPPTREPWDASELRVLFQSPVFTAGLRPTGRRGEAAFWLPIHALFTGARLAELASLGRADVVTDEETGVTCFS
jgi:integrase